MKTFMQHLATTLVEAYGDDKEYVRDNQKWYDKTFPQKPKSKPIKSETDSSEYGDAVHNHLKAKRYKSTHSGFESKYTKGNKTFILRGTRGLDKQYNNIHSLSHLNGEEPVHDLYISSDRGAETNTRAHRSELRKIKNYVEQNS